MAVSLEFYNLLIDKQALTQNGKLEHYLSIVGDSLGLTIWHDDFLIRDGAMIANDIITALRFWMRAGIKPFTRDVSGKKQWNQCCIVASPFGDTCLPCPWLLVSQDGWYAHHISDKSSFVAGREKYCDDEFFEIEVFTKD